MGEPAHEQLSKRLLSVWHRFYNGYDGLLGRLVQSIIGGFTYGVSGIMLNILTIKKLACVELWGKAERLISQN